MIEQQLTSLGRQMRSPVEEIEWIDEDNEDMLLQMNIPHQQNFEEERLIRFRDVLDEDAANDFWFNFVDEPDEEDIWLQQHGVGNQHIVEGIGLEVEDHRPRIGRGIPMVLEYPSGQEVGDQLEAILVDSNSIEFDQEVEDDRPRIGRGIPMVLEYPRVHEVRDQPEVILVDFDSNSDSIEVIEEIIINSDDSSMFEEEQSQAEEQQ